MLGSLLDPLYYAVSAVLWAWHRLFGLVLDPTGGAAWALSVVFLVLTLRALLIKPFLAQVRAGRATRALAPEVAELRRRHAGDAVALARATQALHRERGVGVAGTLLPALVQIPVFVGLLHVLHSFTDPAVGNYALGADEVRSFLAARLFGVPLSGYLGMPQVLLDGLGVERLDLAFVVVPLTLLAALATHLSMRHSLARQPVEGPAAAVSRWLPWIAPLGVLAGGLFFPFPVAILLYWLTQNVWMLVQQRIVFGREDRAAATAAVAATPVPAVARPAPARRRRDGRSRRSRRAR